MTTLHPLTQPLLSSRHGPSALPPSEPCRTRLVDSRFDVEADVREITSGAREALRPAQVHGEFRAAPPPLHGEPRVPAEVAPRTGARQRLATGTAAPGAVIGERAEQADGPARRAAPPCDRREKQEHERDRANDGDQHDREHRRGQADRASEEVLANRTARKRRARRTRWFWRDPALCRHRTFGTRRGRARITRSPQPIDTHRASPAEPYVGDGRRRRSSSSIRSRISMRPATRARRWFGQDCWTMIRRSRSPRPRRSPQRRRLRARADRGTRARPSRDRRNATRP